VEEMMNSRTKAKVQWEDLVDRPAKPVVETPKAPEDP
jgi:hypothetical protein